MPLTKTANGHAGLFAAEDKVIMMASTHIRIIFGLKNIAMSGKSAMFVCLRVEWSGRLRYRDRPPGARAPRTCRGWQARRVAKEEAPLLLGGLVVIFDFIEKKADKCAFSYQSPRTSAQNRP